MNRHQHPSNNSVLGAPPGVPFDECHALPITRVVFEETGSPGVVSYWLPTPDELALLNAGAAMRLTVWGRTHPPLALGVDGDGVM